MGSEDIYVINGDYLALRGKYTAPGESIYYFSVQWDTSTLSWSEFRADVLGSEDPASANIGSIRWQILQDWEALGLAAEPTAADNAVHGSASPFEGVVERCNWLGSTFEEDETAKALIGAGIAKDRLKEWTKDPQVTHSAVAEGGKLQCSHC